MSRYLFTPQAAGDLFEIWSFIATENLKAANRVEEAVHAACEFLAQGPLRGGKREEITSLPVRFWTLQTFPNYLIVYDPNTQPLQIIRILHARRDIAAILGEEQP